MSILPYSPLPGPKGLKGDSATVSTTSPTARTIALGTAYQALDVTKPAYITITLTSTSSVSLSGSVSNAASLVIGPTNAVATGTGIVVGVYENVLGGSLVVGLNLSNKATNSYVLFLPAGWYFGIKQTTGTGVSIVSAFEQKIN